MWQSDISIKHNHWCARALASNYKYYYRHGSNSLPNLFAIQ